MRSDLRALRERIRQVEAGGHRDTPLRRAYNHKLRAFRISGGGPTQLVEIDNYNFKELNHILMVKTKSGNKWSSRKKGYFKLYKNGELHRYKVKSGNQEGKHIGMHIVWRVEEEEGPDHKLLIYTLTGPVSLKSDHTDGIAAWKQILSTYSVANQLYRLQRLQTNAPPEGPVCLYLSKDTINNGDELKYKKMSSPQLLQNLQPNQLVVYEIETSYHTSPHIGFDGVPVKSAFQTPYFGRLNQDTQIDTEHKVLGFVLTVEFKDPDELTEDDLVLYNHTKQYPTDKDGEILKIGEHYLEDKAKGFKQGSVIIAYVDGKWKYGTYQRKSRSSNKHVVSMEEKKNVELEHVYALKLSQIPMDTETSRKLSKRVKN